MATKKPTEVKVKKTTRKGRVGNHLLTKDGLTPNQATFVEEIAAGTPGYKAAMVAYNTDDPSTGNAIAVENLQKPSVREAIDAALQKFDITAETAIKPIADGLKATRTVVGGKDHEVALEVADHPTRLRAAAIALKLMGAESDDSGKSPTTINFNFGSKTYVSNS